MLLKDNPPGGRLPGSLVGPWGASSAPAILDLHTANAQEICYQIQTIVESLGKKQGSHAFLVQSKSIFHNALIHEFISEILVCKLLSYYLSVSVVSSKKAKVSLNYILEQIAVQCIIFASPSYLSHTKSCLSRTRRHLPLAATLMTKFVTEEGVALFIIFILFVF